MAGLVRPRIFPVRDVKDDKQDAGVIYNPHRMSHHGGFDSTSKYPKGDGGGLMSLDPPTSIKTADVSKRSSDD